MANKREARRDRAGLGPDPAESRRRLVSIDAIDGFKIARGEPDVRGWGVRTLSDRELGEVQDLLIDPDRNEVVMLEVALHGNDIRAEVPVRSVQLDRDRKVVIVDSGDLDEATTHRSVARAGDTAGEDLRHRHPEDSEREDARRAEAGAVAAGETARDAEVRRSPEEGADVEERVVERRPFIEEVVVRRRRVEE
jgi:hypothetical protein